MAAEESSVPSVVAMLLCDKVITEAGSYKKTLVGIFDRWLLPQLPTNVGGFWVYGRLTDAAGKYVFKVRFVYLDDDKVLGEAVTDEITATDRLAFFDLAFPVPALAVEKPGLYEIQLYSNDIYIGRTTALVVLREGS